MMNKSALLVMGAAVACALAACGSSSPSGNAAAAQPSAAAPGGAGRPAGQFGPAASGKVAAISGTTMQVQSQQNGQVAVQWTSSTKFRHTVDTTVAAIKAGDCVFASAASGTSSSATTFTAATISVSNSSGTCGFGAGGSGRRPGNFPSGRPSGFPSGRPSGRSSGAPGGGSGRPDLGAIASGKVTSVTGSTVVIAAQGRGGNTTTKTVKVGSSTTLTTEAATTSGSVKVGTCVTAQGKADSSGKVTATNIQITQPTNGQCGFGRRGLGG